MHRTYGWLIPLCLMAACTPYEPTPRPSANISPSPAIPKPPPIPTPSIPTAKEISSPAKSPTLISRSLPEFNLEGVAFDSRTHRLRIIDQAAGPGSEFIDAANVGTHHDALAAINAGFFTPEGAPLGLVIAKDKTSGSWNSASSIGSALWHESNSGDSRISRRNETSPSAAREMSEALQSGPMLVDRKLAVSGLESDKTSARCFIAWDGGTRWFIGRTSPCPLNQLASTLASGKHCGFTIHRAMNLDGGRSADLWISSRVAGGPLTSRPPWNRPVRNFLILTSRR